MDSPIYKVGVCAMVKHANAPDEILLVQPAGKNSDPTDPPPFVLPRGTRAYLGDDGQWHDARTEEAAIEHADALEPLEDTMQREAEEEAGIPPSLFAMRPYRTLGDRVYDSPNKPPYKVHWGVLELQPEDKEKLSKPVDSQAMEWVTLERFQEMVSDGTARQGYLDVAQEAMELMAQGRGGNGR